VQVSALVLLVLEEKGTPANHVRVLFLNRFIFCERYKFKQKKEMFSRVRVYVCNG
jgi:hypothetical protein